jgi:hypothetical protein
MVVYNTGTGGLAETGVYYNDGANWVKIGSGALNAVVSANGTGTTVSGTGSSASPLKVDIAAGGVGATQLADGAVTLAKIAANIIDSTKIKVGGVGLQSLASNSVNSAKIQDGSVAAVDLATNSVTTVKIADVNVTLDKLAGNSVNSAKIVDGSIAAVDIASNAVTTAKILDANVTLAKLADNSVNSAKIVDGSIATADLANAAVTAAKLNQMGATSNQVLAWSGAAWAPTSQAAVIGDGSAGSYLKVTVTSTGITWPSGYSATSHLYEVVVRTGLAEYPSYGPGGSKLPASGRPTISGAASATCEAGPAYLRVWPK